ncbi:uncharacterized protein LOC123547282 [Mercenaria mercenaria]|uniref:uncharacterized protein LOC123547282 n=1 Tax=Mercenaria mercenaria TaxID=6596 RepID=UPI00234EC3A7|nr:uncharacterized protein LOC123547282 [Mercenaria mercenaria]
MAVPGRKAEQHQSSGSATDYEHSCDACLVDGQDVEAHGYCFDCQDHLCVTCFRFHRKNRASRNHRLVDNTASLPAHVTKSSAETCTVTEKCAEHEGQILKFFCLKHEALACHDCVTLDHRRCDIDYIPKTCVGVTESKEYIDTFKKLNDLLEYVNYVQKMTEKKNCEIVNASTRVVEEIDKFQKDVNDRIYQLRCQILGKVASEKKKQNDDIGIVLKTCEKMASDIKQVITSSHENEAAQREGQIYIYMKRAEQIIKSQEIEKAKANLHAIPTEITFKRNREIENIFSHQVTFGTLKIPESTKPIKVKGVHKSASRNTNAFYFNNSRQSEFGDSEGSPSDEEEVDATYIPFKNPKESTKPIKVVGVGKSASRDTNAFYFNNSRQSEFGDSEGSPSDEKEEDATYIPFKNQKESTKPIKVEGVGKSTSRDTNAFYFNNSRQSEFGDSEGSPSDEEEVDATYIPFKNQKDTGRIVTEGYHYVGWN